MTNLFFKKPENRFLFAGTTQRQISSEDSGTTMTLEVKRGAAEPSEQLFRIVEMPSQSNVVVESVSP